VGCQSNVISFFGCLESQKTFHASVYMMTAMCAQSAIFCFSGRSDMLCMLGLLRMLGLLCQEVMLQEFRGCKGLW